MKVVVLYGGLSAEHDISVISAYSIINALLETPYEIEPIYISKDGRWLRGDSMTERLAESDQLYLKPAQVATWGNIDNSEYRSSTGVLIKPGNICHDEVVVFPVLHGPNGEDGTIQGFLEVLDVPYVGAGVAASANALDKIISKHLFDHAGIPQVPYVAFDKRQWQLDSDDWVAKCEGNLLYPFFVKPANMGSSVGISQVNNEEELRAAVEEALTYDVRILVEQGIQAYECEVAILGNEDINVSSVGRLIKEQSFYDFEEKYINNRVEMEIPAELPDFVTDKIREYAKSAYRVINGSGLARVDFFVTNNNDIYLNEINTMPGFTPYSMYPNLWAVTGLDLRNLVEELIQLAIQRHQAKKALKLD